MKKSLWHACLAMLVCSTCLIAAEPQKNGAPTIKKPTEKPLVAAKPTVAPEKEKAPQVKETPAPVGVFGAIRQAWFDLKKWLSSYLQAPVEKHVALGQKNAINESTIDKIKDSHEKADRIVEAKKLDEKNPAVKKLDEAKKSLEKAEAAHEKAENKQVKALDSAHKKALKATEKATEKVKKATDDTKAAIQAILNVK